MEYTFTDKLLIDKDGKVVEQIIGEQTKEQLEGYLKKITP